jgi:hypothetical protein
MSDVDPKSAQHTAPMTARQYSARSATKHRSAGGTRRLFFFALASIWGFIAGVGGTLAAASATGQHIEGDATVLSRLIPALVFAAVGGLVTAAAYRESKRHAR